jgi:hypothetical protein
VQMLLHVTVLGPAALRTLGGGGLAGTLQVGPAETIRTGRERRRELIECRAATMPAYDRFVPSHERLEGHRAQTAREVEERHSGIYIIESAPRLTSAENVPTRGETDELRTRR